jgi:exopolyphosphatase/guanosine-5'-triphosphate,3'-diphosphate pyrophosphatase
MLRVMLEELQPESLVFSSWGLREGLLFRQLAKPARDQDPLLAAVSHFTAPRGASPTIAAMIAGWTANVTNGEGKGRERLRLAATMLAQAAARIEPNMRLGHSLDWALHKRWLALDHAGKVMLGSAIRAACGKPEITRDWLSVASEAELREANAWGLAIRLCRRLGAGSRVSLMTSSLERREDKLILWLDESRAQLASDSVHGDLKALARWLDCDHELRVGEVLGEPVA